MYDKRLCTNYLNDDLNSLCDWSVKWKMMFNPYPTKPAEEVIFTNRNSTSYETVSYSVVDVMSVDSLGEVGLNPEQNTPKLISVSKEAQFYGCLAKKILKRPLLGNFSYEAQ